MSLPLVGMSKLRLSRQHGMSERVDRWRAQASVGVGSLITSYPGLIHLVNICPGTAIESPCSSIGRKVGYVHDDNEIRQNDGDTGSEKVAR